ncbi:hypothetical protein NG799_06925 [Laspinema sp. D1]|uniref:Chromosome segregation ATPase n=1 Tax=Laspinema palackyanum D2a TaxID=2953684 RepID=A0ABT2MMV8_9CYAN|nr:hypothetical protein [Laspinema sp. D2b]MCT7966063.1 hypothetical protein [Laspinema sp. D2a]
MVQYTIAQSPEIILTVSGKDSSKARDKAMDQLLEMMDEGKLPTKLSNKLSEGFSPDEFIEVKEPDSLDESSDDALTEAVQILSSLVTLKEKVDRSHSEALKVREQIDILFQDRPVTEEEIANLKEGFKTLKTFAQANQRYQAAREQAEEARAILDRVLKSTTAE